MLRTIVLALSTAALIATPAATSAQSRHWGGSSNWGSGHNWSGHYWDHHG